MNYAFIDIYNRVLYFGDTVKFSIEEILMYYQLQTRSDLIILFKPEIKILKKLEKYIEL
jgi:hypothetical protein